MTLLISIAGPEFIVQISDRRITVPLASGDAYLVSDERNKELVVRSPKVTAGIMFTGLAELEGQLVSDWLLQIISPADAESGMERIVNRIQNESNRIWLDFARLGRRYPHAFIVTGFERVKDATVTARTFILTNCIDPTFKSNKVRDHFEIFAGSDGALSVMTAGNKIGLVHQCRADSSRSTPQAKLCTHCGCLRRFGAASGTPWKVWKVHRTEL